MFLGRVSSAFPVLNFCLWLSLALLATSAVEDAIGGGYQGVNGKLYHGVIYSICQQLKPLFYGGPYLAKSVLGGQHFGVKADIANHS